MDDDDIFNAVNEPPPAVNNPPATGMDTGLGGFSFDPNPAPSPAPSPPAADPFNLMGLDFGGSSQPPPAQPPDNTGFGGDLLGFGSAPSNPAPTQPPVTQPSANTGMGADLMGFGFSSGPTQPTPPPAANNNNMGGFSFDTPPVAQPPVAQPPVAQPPVAQPQVDLGFDMLGSSQPSQPKAQNTSGFQPITNTNPNKVLAY